jgi:hypothetical protein
MPGGPVCWSRRRSRYCRRNSRQPEPNPTPDWTLSGSRSQALTVRNPRVFCGATSPPDKLAAGGFMAGNRQPDHGAKRTHRLLVSGAERRAATEGRGRQQADRHESKTVPKAHRGSGQSAGNRPSYNRLARHPAGRPAAIRTGPGSPGLGQVAADAGDHVHVDPDQDGRRLRLGGVRDQGLQGRVRGRHRRPGDQLGAGRVVADDVRGVWRGPGIPPRRALSWPIALACVQGRICEPIVPDKKGHTIKSRVRSSEP